MKMIRLLHDDMTAAVLYNGKSSEPFSVDAGVKQGCVIAPTLFSLFMGADLQLDRPFLNDGVDIQYRIDGNIMNLRRRQAKTKVSFTTIVELQYANVSAVCSCSEDGMQSTVDAFALAYSRLGLTLNISKTETMFQHERGYPSPTDYLPSIQINGAELNAVNNFKYLESTFSSNASLDMEIQSRISAAATAYNKLRKRIFCNNDILSNTKINVYNAIIIPTLLYGCETWVTYRKHIKQLETYHQRCLRRILHIKWQDRVTNTAVFERTSSQSLESIALLHRLRWAGHVCRMPDCRLPKQLYYSQLSHDTRSVGAPTKRHKDLLKHSLPKCGINANECEQLAADRQVWKNTTRKSVLHFENTRLTEEAVRREQRKAATQSAP